MKVHMNLYAHDTFGYLIDPVPTRLRTIYDTYRYVLGTYRALLLVEQEPNEGGVRLRVYRFTSETGSRAYPALGLLFSPALAKGPGTSRRL